MNKKYSKTQIACGNDSHSISITPQQRSKRSPDDTVFALGRHLLSDGTPLTQDAAKKQSHWHPSLE
jgi:hypothetical protein